MNAQARFTDSCYDVEVIRRDFPILSREVYGKPLVYLDNAASAQKPRAVLERMRQAMEEDYAIFTRNATDAINLVAQSFGGMVIGEDDEIVLSIMEHHSNIVPWHFHRERRGAILKWAPVD